MAPIAPGSDGAGSIRIPASFCGLFGFKPSRGAIPNPFAAVDPAGLAAIGPLARSVRDGAALLDVLNGDPLHHATPREGSFLAACARPPRALRLRLSVKSPLTPVDPQVESRVLDAARKLEALGHRIEEAPPLDGDLAEFLPLLQRIIANVPLPRFMDRFMEPTTRWMRAEGRRHSAAEVRAMRAPLEARITGWLGDADALVLPTVAQLPPRVGAFSGLHGEAMLRAVVPIGAFTAPFNVSGQPAASVHAGLSAEGLPIGVQLVGRAGADRQLIALCASLEEALRS
jgi:amidase